MGKAKQKDAETFSFAVDLKTVLSLRPEQRPKWLSKACRKVADGEANVKHLYDVLSSRKLVGEMAEKVGRRMLRVLREHLYLFSEKQQRFLTEESALATHYSIEERSEEEAEEPESTARTSHMKGDDAAARMEEMMARCRDFVREKAGTFDQRRVEAEEAERQAQLDLEREAAEQLAREWDAIHQWHRKLEGWEQAHMAACDDRLQVHMEMEAASRARGRSCHSSDSSRGGSSDGERRHKKDKEKRRRRDRRRRRDSSSRDSSSHGRDYVPEKRPRVDKAKLPTSTLADLLRGKPS
mmetsp:Transcript_14077/g.29499  ORF Transcript_14077/g.29499 Transcript_14077/m.29499 type:complete len:296 (+) Transcript_14077:71-958(+)